MRADQSMTIRVEAVYENGVLKPAQPLPLKWRKELKDLRPPLKRDKR
jgi:predicted DNA-binding antitoxin AbrB/MazE fold protein